MEKLLSIIAVVLCTASLASADLMNGSFEIGPADQETGVPYWSATNPAAWNQGGTWGQASVRDWRAHEGSQTAAFSAWGDEGSDSAWWQDEANNLGEDSVWTASAWFWNDYGGSQYTNTRTEMKIEFYDASYTLLDSETTEFSTTQDETWFEVTCTAIAPADAAWSRFITVSPACWLLVYLIKLEVYPILE